MLGLYTLAQSADYSESNDCSQLQTVLEDARNGFRDYAGEETDMDYYYFYYEYDFSLWNDEGRECMYGHGGDGYVNFWYSSTYSLDDAKTFHGNLLQKVKECLPSNYFLNSTDSEYSLVYYEFSDDRDKENLSTPKYPQIEVTIEEKDDYYYVAISIFAPYRD
jgi:hypothetical protein